jgi:cytochrome-b5 reductase
LAEVEKINHNTSIFRFELPKDHIAGLPVATCLVVKHTPEGEKPIIRPYTPVSKSEVSVTLDA